MCRFVSLRTRYRIVLLAPRCDWQRGCRSRNHQLLQTNESDRLTEEGVGLMAKPKVGCHLIVYRGREEESVGTMLLEVTKTIETTNWAKMLRRPQKKRLLQMP